MKRNTKYAITLILMLHYAIGAWATPTVEIIKQLNGVTTTTTLTGDVVYSIADNDVCTLTITPAQGNYVTKEFIAVYSTVTGDMAQTRKRSPNLDADKITVSANDEDADPSATTKYTFNLPNDGSNVEVTVNFQTRIDVSSLTIEDIEEQTYTGSKIEPTATVKDGEKTLALDTDYAVSYTNNTNAGIATATITGQRTYTGTATKNFTISKADINPTVSITGWTYGSTANKPSVEGNPGGGSVTYSYKAEGEETYSSEVPTAVGTYTVKAEIAETNNYNSGEATTTFTIGKGTAALVFSDGSPTATLGWPFTPPTLTTTPADLTGITYSSSNQAAATVDENTGDVTLAGIGETTITASFAGNDNYEAAEASYLLTVTEGEKSEPSLSFSAESATATYGDETAATPTLNNPDNLWVTYASSNPDVATVDENGTVHIVGAGETVISASYEGDYAYTEMTVSYTLTVNKVKPTLTFSATAIEITTEEAFEAPSLTITPNDLEGITFTSSDEEVAAVDASGTVTIAGAGTTTITASFAGNDNYEAAEASYTLTIKKVEPKLAYAVSAVETTMDDKDKFEAPALTVTPNDLEGITFTSSNEEVATVDASGAVTLIGEGTTTITASFAGNGKYDKAEASYTLTVKKGDGYDLWIGGVRVTKKNYKDVLGNDNAVFFDPNSSMLILSDNEAAVEIESRLPMLTIFLNGSNTLERICFNNGGKTENVGQLAITTYCNIPGSLSLSTGSADGVISGFSSVDIDTAAGLHVMDPVGGTYDTATQTFIDAEGGVVSTASIGQSIQPLVEGTVVNFPEEEFVNTDEAGNKTDEPLDNKTINDVLYTLTDQDGYDTTDGTIVLNTVILPEDVYVLGERVENGELLPGSAEYADAFRGGITFMVPDGTGEIILEVETEPGYKLMLQIGTSTPMEIRELTMNKVQIAYDVPKPTYIFLYLALDGAAPASVRDAYSRIGKRETTHVRLNSIQVSPKRAASSNPLSNVQDIPENINQEEVVTGIVTIPAVQAAQSDRWYTIDGVQTERPTKKGLYIRNGRKYVIK